MNKIFSHILVGGASALVGAVAGYFFCKKKMQDEVDEAVSERVNEELAKIRKTKSEEKDDVEAHVAENPFDEAAMYNAARNVIYTEFKDEGLNDYRVALLAQCLVDCQKEGLNEDETDAKIHALLAETECPTEDDSPYDYDEYPEDEEVSDEYNEPQMIMDEWSEKPPTIVTVHDYSRLPPYFEFLTYHYFEDDDTLIDDGDELIDDIDRIVGDALVHFGECDPKDDDTVYVVNGRMGLAIEIVRYHSAYSEWTGWGSYAENYRKPQRYTERSDDE